MKKFLIFFFLLSVCTSYADAKRYIVTVFTESRAPINWDAFVTRSGGEVVKKFKFMNAALLDLTPQQVENLQSRAMKGVVIEEDLNEYWLEDDFGSSAMGAFKKYAAEQPSAGKNNRNKNNVPPAANIAPVAVSTPTAWEDGAQNKEYPWGVSRMFATGAWNIAQGAGVKVAVIDTGVNYNHEDLSANYAGGVNFTYEGDEEDPMDGHGHGTHVAGIIAAARNGKGVVGVAPKAKIYAVKVLTSDGHGDRSAVISGIEWATEHGMNVINMSLGSTQMTVAQRTAIQEATARGIIVVCSAGNRGPTGVMSYPGLFPETIAVAASDKFDKVASFSSRGPEVDVIAPGVRIYSTLHNGEYGYKSGTSMAAPHVSGLAALAISAGNPSKKVRQLIQDNTIRLPNLTENEQGRGLANAAWIKK